ncbi:NAD(P)-dependent oxidoreductase [Rhizobium laguerreae]|uniref:NAD-dependent epimerase/dehydratase family protein n=1 Tax=Rhizobium laguerreae TaxID=1076926 RepID=UPI001C903923|nr:NAD(P)-dependent oxidoreductase [Rhizobium laguerreae]MBY3463663.1 NAD(P)-dependent oxidoreductase [Rhizobium laguerreae]
MGERSTATIIGSGGFIGQALTRHLQAAGWTCHLPSRDVAWPQCGALHGHIFYCAGLTADFARRPADTIEAHVSLVSRVLQSEKYDSLVYLSSTRLYDGLPAGVEATEDLCFPVSPREPRHLYDLSKLMGEAACLALGSGRARIARLASVYDSRGGDDGFLPQLLDKIAVTRRGGEIRLASSPAFSRDYVHMDDVVAGLVHIATKGKADIYNVASGKNIRNGALASLIQETSGRRIRFEPGNVPVDPPVIDVTRMAGEFGWRPDSVAGKLSPLLSGLD